MYLWFLLSLLLLRTYNVVFASSPVPTSFIQVLHWKRHWYSGRKNYIRLLLLQKYQLENWTEKQIFTHHPCWFTSRLPVGSSSRVILFFWLCNTPFCPGGFHRPKILKVFPVWKNVGVRSLIHLRPMLANGMSTGSCRMIPESNHLNSVILSIERRGLPCEWRRSDVKGTGNSKTYDCEHRSFSGWFHFCKFILFFLLKKTISNCDIRSIIRIR